jgi:CRISPR/Cas system-associated exonuclease Cas4 (RecB family)
MMSGNDELSARFMNAILTAQPFQSKVSRDYAYASEVPNCIRQTFYRITKTKVDEGRTDSTLSFPMAYGNQFESLITQQMCYSEEITYKGKLKADNDDLGVHGETDPACIFEGKSIVTEAKGTYRDNYLKILNDMRQGKYPKKYYDQLQYYLWVLKELDLGMMIIGNRDMRPGDRIPPIIVAPIERDSKWREINFDRLTLLKNCIKEQKEPPREFGPKSTECKYCPFFNTCYRDGVDSVSEPNFGDDTVS